MYLLLRIPENEIIIIFIFIVGDIGGSMGLFIGASMLTIVEIFDLFLSQLQIFASKEEKTKKFTGF